MALLFISKQSLFYLDDKSNVFSSKWRINTTFLNDMGIEPSSPHDLYVCIFELVH
jgi:hypothetical protein